MRINHNMMAMNTARQLNVVGGDQAKSMEKLSSGYRINRAGDDAAGLAISEKMRAQVRGLNQASRNAQDGISLIQTAEGALTETHAILQRMRELSNQSANGTNTDLDRGSLQDEMNQLTSEINRIGNSTEFNTQKILNGGMDSADGSQMTEATSATKTLKNAMKAGGADVIAGVKITVDDVTFDLEGVTLDSGDAAGSIDALKNVTSGGTKLGDMVDITSNAGVLTFTAKSTGENSTIEFAGADDPASGLIAADDAGAANAVKGTPTTVERAGLEATAGLAGDVAIADGDSFTIAVGSESGVTVNLDANTYNIGNADANVAAAARDDLIKDLNAALQDAGLSGKVTASLSADDKVQFISETGLDIKITDGATDVVETKLGYTTATDMATPTNVEQVVGPGAQGSGFNTSFQIGANNGQSMGLTINDMRSAALGITGNAGQAGFTSSNTVTNGTTDVTVEAALDLTSKESAAAALDVLDQAMNNVSTERGKLGAVQNRLEHTIKNLDTSAENLQAAESRIRDVDMAKEMMEFTKNNILSQAAQSMLAQANQSPQGVLQLLR